MNGRGAARFGIQPLAAADRPMKIEVVGISDRGFLLGDQHDDNYCVIGVPEPANISLEDMLQIENVNSKTDLKVAKNESCECRSNRSTGGRSGGVFRSSWKSGKNLVPAIRIALAKSWR